MEYIDFEKNRNFFLFRYFTGFHKKKKTSRNADFFGTKNFSFEKKKSIESED